MRNKRLLGCFRGFGHYLAYFWGPGKVPHSAGIETQIQLVRSGFLAPLAPRVGLSIVAGSPGGKRTRRRDARLPS